MEALNKKSKIRSWQNALKALEIVYTGDNKQKYFLITVCTALVIFLVNIQISNYKIIISNFSISLFFSLLWGTLNSITLFSLTSLVVTSVLAGVLLSMTLFLLKSQVKEGAGRSIGGILVSFITPACPSCALGLLSLFGLGGLLGFLPFKGLELGVLGIIILGTLIIYLANKITTKICKLEKK